VKRRSSSFNTGRIDHLYQDTHRTGVKFFLHYGDMTDATTDPPGAGGATDEIYNLAAQSHVQVSFETPEYTPTPTASGTCVSWKRIRILGLKG